jgi:hypothetical protein
MKDRKELAMQIIATVLLVSAVAIYGWWIYPLFLARPSTVMGMRNRDNSLLWIPFLLLLLLKRVWKSDDEESE